MNSIVLKFFLISLIGTLCSCVGTIDNSASNLTDTSNATPSEIKFAGVSKIIPISDSKLEIYFPKATGGSGKYTYEVYVGDLPAKEIPWDILDKQSGPRKVTISNLLKATRYAVKVEARDAFPEDPSSIPRSNNQKFLLGTTFSNEVCKFNGISAIENVPGEAGKDSLRIKWVPAEFNSLDQLDIKNPTTYKVTMAKVDGPGEYSDSIENVLNDSSLAAISGRYEFNIPFVVGSNETTIRGLPPDSYFFTRVRCVHRGSVQNEFQPEQIGEANNNVIFGKTLSNEAPSISEETIKFNLMPGRDGYTGVRISWGEIVGAFSHIRVYARPSGSPPVMPGETCIRSDFCEKVNFDETELYFTGLEPNTAYDFQWIICLTYNCQESAISDGAFIGPTGNLTTTPPNASFNGVTSFSLDYTPGNFGTVHLQFDLPDFNTGFVDNYVVKVRKNSVGNFENLIESGLDITLDEDYDVLTDTEVTLRNVRFGSNFDKYEFQIYTQINGLEFGNSSVVTIDLTPNPGSDLATPSLSDFRGLNKDLSIATGNYLRARWTIPVKGFYNYYDFYLTKCNGPNEQFDSSCSPFTSNSKITHSIPREEIEGNSNTIEYLFPVDITENFKIGIIPSFYFPTIVSGKLNSVINRCTWTCQNSSGTFTCEKDEPLLCPAD